MKNNELRVAVIGAGRWGPNLIRNFAEHPRASLVWVADRSTERLDHVASRYPEVKLTADALEPLDDESIDAVVIATPASTHFELAMKALAQGKHCLVEKPLATDLAEARQLCEAAAASNLVLAVGHVFLYNAAIRRVRHYLDEGAIRDIRYVSAVRTNLGPPGIDVNVAWDLASHDISIANYWIGEKPVLASAVGGSWISANREDTIFASLRYESGSVLHLNVSWLNPVKTRALTLVGDRKMVTVDDMNLEEPVRLYDKGIDVDDDSFADTFGAFRSRIREGDVTIPRIMFSEPLREECGSFIAAVLDGTPVPADGASAIPVVAAIAAINESLALDGRSCEVQQ